MAQGTFDDPKHWVHGEVIVNGDIFIVRAGDGGPTNPYNVGDYYEALKAGIIDDNTVGYPPAGYYNSQWIWRGTRIAQGSFDDPQHWVKGVTFNYDDIFQVQAGDGSPTNPYRVGDYYEALTSGVIDDNTVEYPPAGSNNDAWRWRGSRYNIIPQGTFAYPYYWFYALHFNKGDIFQVQAGDGGATNPYRVGDYYRALKGGKIGGYPYYPRPGSNNDGWQWAGTKNAPNSIPHRGDLNDPKRWVKTVIYRVGDIFQVQNGDGGGTPNYIAGSYYESLKDGTIGDNTLSYPSAGSSNAQWKWLGKKAYRWNNPKYWEKGLEIAIGDIFQVQDGDSHPNSPYTVGDYYEALQAVVIDDTTLSYPPSQSSNAQWQWRGSKLDIPRIWEIDLKVRKEDIFQIIDTDVANNPQITLGDYYQAKFDGSISNIHTYPNRSGDNNWNWLGSKFSLPKIWIPQLKVTKGDTFMVVANDLPPDPERNNSELGMYYEALFDGYLTRDYYSYPDGFSNNYWQRLGHQWTVVENVTIQSSILNDNVNIYDNGLYMVRIDVYMTNKNPAGIVIKIDDNELNEAVQLLDYDTQKVLDRKKDAPTLERGYDNSGWHYTVGVYNDFTDIILPSASFKEVGSTTNNPDFSIKSQTDEVAVPGNTLVRCYLCAKDLDQFEKQGISIGTIITTPQGAVFKGSRISGRLINHVKINVLNKPDLSIDDFTLTKTLIKANSNERDDGSEVNQACLISASMLWRQFNFSIKFSTTDKYRRKIVDSQFVAKPDRCQFLDKIDNGYRTHMFMFVNRDVNGTTISPTEQTFPTWAASIGGGYLSILTGFNKNTIVITYIIEFQLAQVSYFNNFDCEIKIYDQYGNAYTLYPSYAFPTNGSEAYAKIKDISWQLNKSNLISITKPLKQNVSVANDKISLYNTTYSDGYLFSASNGDYSQFPGDAMTGIPRSSSIIMSLKSQVTRITIPSSTSKNPFSAVATTISIKDTSNKLIPDHSPTGRESNPHCKFNDSPSMSFLFPIWDKQEFSIVLAQIYYQVSVYDISISYRGGLKADKTGNEGGTGYRQVVVSTQSLGDTWQMRS